MKAKKGSPNGSGPDNYNYKGFLDQHFMWVKWAKMGKTHTFIMQSFGVNISFLIKGWYMDRFCYVIQLC